MVEFIIGIFVGAFLFWVFVDRKRSSGTFIVDMSNPLEETFRLEIHDSFGELCTKKQIHFDVKVRNDNSLN